MKLKTILIISLCFWVSDIFSQEWIFEYESEYNTTVYNTWNNNENQNTIHAVGVSLVPGSGKNLRTRLIELNQDGELISFFQAKECNIHAIYHPYGQDSIISVSRKCNGHAKNTFNVFNSSGKKLLTKEFENNYSRDKIIALKNGISILRSDMQKYGTEFHLLELSMNDKTVKYSFPFKDLQDEQFKVRFRSTLKSRKGDYLLGAQLYETDKNSVVINHYPKLLFIKEGEIKWVKTFKGKLKTIETIMEADSGYLVHGKDDNGLQILIMIDGSGNELNAFEPIGLFRSYHPQFYLLDNRLFSIDKKIRGTTIYLHEYDINSGELIWHKNIITDYSRIENLKIGTVGQNYIILSGAFFRSPTTKGYTGFVMKTVIQDSIYEKPIVTKEIVMPLEDLVQESSEEIFSIKVYPNPAKFKVTFEIESEDEQAGRLLRILSTDGALVMSKEFVGNQIEIDISMLPRGTYFYKVSTSGKEDFIQGKFIAQ